MIERELKRYFADTPVIANAVGGIYAGRIPQADTSREAIVIHGPDLTAGRIYGLYGEDDVAQPILQVDIVSKMEASSAILHAIFTNCRKAINVYAAAPGLMGETWVSSAQIVSESVTLNPSVVGLQWKRQRSFDVMITHEQETEFA